MNSIVIKVWRGIVAEVYADDPNITVTVIDEDELTDQSDTPLPEHQVY